MSFGNRPARHVASGTAVDESGGGIVVGGGGGIATLTGSVDMSSDMRDSINNYQLICKAAEIDSATYSAINITKCTGNAINTLGWFRRLFYNYAPFLMAGLVAEVSSQCRVRVELLIAETGEPAC